MIDILWSILRKSGKKFKMKSQDRKTSFMVKLTENFLKLYHFGSRDFYFNFFEIFSKMHPYRLFKPSVHFFFYDIFGGSTTITRFFQLLKS